MIEIPALLAKLELLSTTIDNIPVSAPPVDLQPVADAIDAIQAKATAKVLAV